MQDYSDVLVILQKDLEDRSADVRSAMDVVNQLKTLIANIQGMQNAYTDTNTPQIVSDASPPPTV